MPNSSASARLSSRSVTMRRRAGIHVDVPQQQRQHAATDAAEADHQHPARKLHQRPPR
jgi:hypothetical protein